MSNPAIEIAAEQAGWNRQRWVFWLLIAVALHFGLIFSLGTRNTPRARTVANAPHLQLVDSGDLFAALTDPTLFVVPHENLDCFPAEWQRPPEVAKVTFDWSESPNFLPMNQVRFGEKFSSYLQTNHLVTSPVNLKPSPRVQIFPIASISSLPTASALHISGKLAERELLQPIAVPTLTINDVLQPSRIQVLVDASGTVLSTALTESSESDEADAVGLQLARSARFKPSAAATLGELVFEWHTQPKVQ